MVLYDPSADGFGKLLACVLCELLSALASLLLGLARQACELLVLAVGWLLAAVRVGAYVSAALLVATISPSTGWLLLTVCRIAEDVAEAGTRGRGVGVLLTETCDALAMLALFDICVSEVPAAASWAAQLLTRHFHRAMDVEISLPDHLVRCYMPSDSESPGSRYICGSGCGDTTGSSVVPEHDQHLVRDYGILRVIDAWMRDALNKIRQERKRARLGVPLSSSFLPSAPRRASRPAQGLVTRKRRPQTLERAEAQQELLPTSLQQRPRAREDAGGASAGIPTPIQHPEDGSASAGKGKCPIVALEVTVETPDSSPELRDGNSQRDKTVDKILDGSRGPEGEAGQGPVMIAQLTGPHGTDGKGGWAPIIIVHEPANVLEPQEVCHLTSSPTAAREPETLPEGPTSDELRCGTLIAVGSKGEELDARGTDDGRCPPEPEEPAVTAAVNDEPALGRARFRSAGVAPAAEASVGADGQAAVATSHVDGSQPEASGHLLASCPRPIGDAASVLESYMEWESSCVATVAQALAHHSGSVTADCYGSLVELDSMAANETYGLREPTGEVAAHGPAGGSENSMVWEETYAMAARGSAEAEELALRGLSLTGTPADSEHMDAVEASGPAGAVLEAMSHETAGLDGAVLEVIIRDMTDRLAKLNISDNGVLLEDRDMVDVDV